MSEHGHDEAAAGSAPGVVPSAVAALEGLDERPLAEHLGAFEQAHRALRSALGL